MQVREKEDRHQQQKISGFLRPLEDIQAAREAVSAAADMEVCCHALRLNDWASCRPAHSYNPQEALNEASLIV